MPEDEDITMDDDGLRRMVTRLMRRSPEDIEEGHMKIDPDPRPPDEIIEKSRFFVSHLLSTLVDLFLLIK